MKMDARSVAIRSAYSTRAASLDHSRGEEGMDMGMEIGDGDPVGNC